MACNSEPGKFFSLDLQTLHLTPKHAEEKNILPVSLKPGTWAHAEFKGSKIDRPAFWPAFPEGLFFPGGPTPNLPLIFILIASSLTFLAACIEAEAWSWYYVSITSCISWQHTSKTRNNYSLYTKTTWFISILLKVNRRLPVSSL